jgi:hypothetical protein
MNTKEEAASDQKQPLLFSRKKFAGLPKIGNFAGN